MGHYNISRPVPDPLRPPPQNRDPQTPRIDAYGLIYTADPLKFLL